MFLSYLFVGCLIDLLIITEAEGKNTVYVSKTKRTPQCVGPILETIMNSPYPASYHHTPCNPSGARSVARPSSINLTSILSEVLLCKRKVMVDPHSRDTSQTSLQHIDPQIRGAL
jgi:hypothetical protein